MNLKGKLADFALADVLQLVAKQMQSGILHLRSGDETIQLAIANGFVVSASCSGRRDRERLGAMLVRAEVVAPEDLDRALEVQRRTLRRLGDILVDLGAVSSQALKEMLALQAMETACRVFTWSRGSYEFEPGAVEWDQATATPISSEALLVEGHRRLDEWPGIRKRIGAPSTTFRRSPGSSPPPADAGLSALERRALELAEPGRSAERIVDLSRAGEFEASKALATLVSRGLLEPLPGGGSGSGARDLGGRLATAAARLTGTLALAALLAGLGWLAVGRAPVREGQVRLQISDRAAERLVARQELARLRAALEVWRLEHGEYPPALRALVDAGLVRPAELRRPYPEEYYYRRGEPDGFVLLPPLP